jgi:hypothetical protein
MQLAALHTVLPQLHMLSQLPKMQLKYYQMMMRTHLPALSASQVGLLLE